MDVSFQDIQKKIIAHLCKEYLLGHKFSPVISPDVLKLERTLFNIACKKLFDDGIIQCQFTYTSTDTAPSTVQFIRLSEPALDLIEHFRHL